MSARIDAGLAVPQLLANHLPVTPGADAGVCYVCGQHTALGHRRPPSDLFTAWASCTAGDVLCPACLAVLTHRPCRMFPWCVTPDRFRVQAKDDPGWFWDALLDPPDPPFALYLPRKVPGQKQGWLTLVPYVSMSRTRFAVGTDWTDAPVTLDAATRDADAALIGRLRERTVSKTALLTGAWTMKTYQTALTEGWADDLDAARARVGDPRWEVMCIASR